MIQKWERHGSFPSNLQLGIGKKVHAQDVYEKMEEINAKERSLSVIKGGEFYINFRLLNKLNF